MVSLHFLMKQLKFLYFSAGCFCGRFILHSNHKLLAWRSLKENAAINSSTRGETYHHSHIDMCVNSNKLICNWFRFSQPFIVLFTWQIGIYADTCPGNFKRSRFFRVKTNWSHISFAKSMHSPLLDSIIIRRWRRELNSLILTKISSFFEDWQTFICKWFCHAINLRSNRLTMEFLSGFRSFSLSLFTKSGRTCCVSSFDVNISIELNAHCAHTQCCDPLERFWANSKATDGWMDWSSFACGSKEKREREAWRWPWQWAQPSKAASCSKIGHDVWLLSWLMTALSKLMRICLFSCIAVHFQYTLIRIVRKQQIRIH